MRQNWLRKVVLREKDVVFQKQNRVQTYLSFSSFFFEIFTLAIPVDTKKKNKQTKKNPARMFFLDILLSQILRKPLWGLMALVKWRREELMKNGLYFLNCRWESRDKREWSFSPFWVCSTARGELITLEQTVTLRVIICQKLLVEIQPLIITHWQKWHH